MKRKDDFPLRIAVKVAERAGYLCSSPYHLRITIGPCESDANKSTKNGIASHICAASIGGPRYEPLQSPAERKSIANAIWLCADCSLIIDKNGGVDFTAQELRTWKKNHEAYVKQLQLSGYNPLLSFRQGSVDSKDVEIAAQTIKILETQGALFVPFDQEVPPFVVQAVEDIRRELRLLRSQLRIGSLLDERLKAMQEACRHYMNSTPTQPTLIQLQSGLGSLRKSFGIHLEQMQKQYNVTLDANLMSLLPQN